MFRLPAEQRTVDPPTKGQGWRRGQVSLKQLPQHRWRGSVNDGQPPTQRTRQTALRVREGRVIKIQNKIKTDSSFGRLWTSPTRKESLFSGLAMGRPGVSRAHWLFCLWRTRCTGGRGRSGAQETLSSMKLLVASSPGSQGWGDWGRNRCRQVQFGHVILPPLLDERRLLLVKRKLFHLCTRVPIFVVTPQWLVKCWNFYRRNCQCISISSEVKRGENSLLKDRKVERSHCPMARAIHGPRSLSLSLSYRWKFRCLLFTLGKWVT